MPNLNRVNVKLIEFTSEDYEANSRVYLVVIAIVTKKKKERQG